MKILIITEPPPCMLDRYWRHSTYRHENVILNIKHDAPIRQVRIEEQTDASQPKNR